MKVGIAGLGAIGMALVEALDRGVDGLELAAVASRDANKAASQVASCEASPVVCGIGELAAHSDIVALMVLEHQTQMHILHNFLLF